MKCVYCKQPGGPDIHEACRQERDNREAAGMCVVCGVKRATVGRCASCIAADSFDYVGYGACAA